MKLKIVIGLFLLSLLAFLTSIIYMMGDGGFKRMVTITGIYSICKPDGYEVVCFLDADGNEGGMFCVPLSAVGGECKK
jgi:hypothetical protein